MTTGRSYIAEDYYFFLRRRPRFTRFTPKIESR
jgi:hypothetical protein